MGGLKAGLARAGVAARAVPDSLRVLGRGLALVVVAAPAMVGGCLALTILLGVLPPLRIWLTKLIVDGLARGAGDAPVIAPALLYALTLVLAAGAQPVQQELASWLEGRAVGEVDRRLMGAGARLVDLDRIERPAFQDELRLLQEGIYYPPRLLLMLQRLLEPLLALGGILLLLGRLHPLLPVALAAATAPQLVTGGRVRRQMYQALARRTRAAREMDYCARVTTEPDAAKEIRVFGLGEFFRRRFRDRRAAALAEVSRLRLRELRLAALFGVVQALTLAGAFWYVATQAQAGRLTLGDLALYLNAVIQAESQLLFLPFTVGVFHEALLRLRPLFAFLDDAAPAIALAPEGRGRPAPAAPRAGVELRGVGFRYPEGGGVVLDGVSATLPAGRVTAIVGINGAGKSTLVKLLTRMYDPDAGAILLDGVPLAEYDLASLRGRIAVVHQDFARFALTLGENIAVGAATPGRAGGRVTAAAHWAGADGVAAKLPHGYDTPLTRRFEGGVELSGGEWQKVALARGFARDAALVILDEPTAALDAEAEEALFARFRELVAGKTALLISHRFSTVRLADQILVLEGGRIVEAGSHAELVARGGCYAALYELQAGRYRQC